MAEAAFACERCGQGLAEGTQFCHFCGGPVVRRATPPPPPPPPVSAAAGPPAPPPPPPPAYPVKPPSRPTSPAAPATPGPPAEPASAKPGPRVASEPPATPPRPATTTNAPSTLAVGLAANQDARTPAVIDAVPITAVPLAQKPAPTAPAEPRPLITSVPGIVHTPDPDRPSGPVRRDHGGMMSSPVAVKPAVSAAAAWGGPLGAPPGFSPASPVAAAEPAPLAPPPAAPPIAFAAPDRLAYPVTAGPARSAGFEVDDEADQTRLAWPKRAVPPPAPAVPAATAFDLVFDSGRRVRVDGPALIGRDPADAPGIAAIAIDDPGLSISKAHLEVGLEAGRLWVMDRGSTNGSALACPGLPAQPLTARQRYGLAPGDTVVFGERSFRVEEAS